MYISHPLAHISETCRYETGSTTQIENPDRFLITKPGIKRSPKEGNPHRIKQGVQALPKAGFIPPRIHPPNLDRLYRNVVPELNQTEPDYAVDRQTKAAHNGCGLWG